MSLAKPVIYDGSLQRQVQPGDVVGASEVVPATSVSNALTVTGQMLANNFIQSTETANATYTLDSAANILAALTSGPGNSPIQNGTTFRLRHINNAAFTVTYAVTANTGVSVVLPVVNASSVKDFLFYIANGQPPVTFSGTTVNGSAVVSNVSQAALALMTIGQVVTNAVAGLQGTTVVGINIAAGTVTFSGNANATNTTAVAVTVSPVVILQGIGQGLL